LLNASPVQYVSTKEHLSRQLENPVFAKQIWIDIDAEARSFGDHDRPVFDRESHRQKILPR